jgi:hypothetical protein
MGIREKDRKGCGGAVCAWKGVYDEQHYSNFMTGKLSSSPFLTVIFEIYLITSISSINK